MTLVRRRARRARHNPGMDRDAVELLTRPAAWPHPITGMEVVETHASWVFLTGEYAYKVKKPVNFGFLDFSTLERRRHCCEEEVRLNRRLAPDLYLGVVPITGSPPRVGGDGTPVEYAVKMRQFDMACGFDRLAERRELEAFHIDATAAVLGSFHAETPRADVNSGFGTPAEIAEYVLENFQQIEPHIEGQSPGSRERFGRVEHWSRAACERHRECFAERLAEGPVFFIKLN